MATYCTNCGFRNDNEADFCTNCGERLFKPNAGSIGNLSNAEKRPNASKGLGTGAIIGIVSGSCAVLIAAVCVVCFIVAPGSNQPNNTVVVESDLYSNVTPETDTNTEEIGGLDSNVSMGNYPNGGSSSGGGVSRDVEKGKTVTLKTKTTSGETVSGTVTRDKNGYVIADSSTKTYTVSELKSLGLTDAEVCVAWNEPFARLGYHFKNSALREYFNSCTWYKDTGWNGSLTSNSPGAINNVRLKSLLSDDSPWLRLVRE
jgi:hypothetical protein